MAKPYVEAEVKNKVIVRIDAPFDEALEGLRSRGIESPMTSKELAYARIHSAEGKESSLMTRGSYTKAGFAYMKGENPIRVANSPLLDKALAEQATQANRNGQYFATQDERMYEQFAKLAEKDKTKEPEKRRAIILPSRGVFQISPTQNSKVFATIFGKTGKEYLEFLGFDSLKVYPVDKNTVDSQSGTILTQEWLAWLGGASLVAGARDLDFDGTVRGVKSLTGEASSQKTKRTLKSYSVRELDAVVKLVEGVKLGNLPASKLEKALKFTDKLRGNR